MSFESDTDREAMLRGLGGVRVSAPLGQLTGLLEVEPATVEDMVDSDQPGLTVRTSECSRCGIAYGSTVEIDGVFYIVRRLRPDGTGMTVLTLEAP